MSVRRVRSMLARVNTEVKRAFKSKPPTTREAAAALVQSWLAPAASSVPSSVQTQTRAAAEPAAESTATGRERRERKNNIPALLLAAAIGRGQTGTPRKRRRGTATMCGAC